jgi:hypothetical protein
MGEKNYYRRRFKMRKFLLFFALVFLVSCSTVTNLDYAKLNIKDKKITVFPFENYTETPLAGLRVKGIAEGGRFFQRI